MQNFLFISLTLFLIACGNKENNNDNKFSEFPQNIEAYNKHKIHQFGNDNFARQLAINDGFIYLFDYENKPYIRKFDKHFNFLDSLGISTDFNIDNPFFQHFDKNGDFVFINESEYLSTYKENDSFINVNSLELIDEIETNRLLNGDGIFQAFSLDSTIVLDAYYPKSGDFFVFNKNNNERSKWIDFIHPLDERNNQFDDEEFPYVLYRNKINLDAHNMKLIQVFSNFPTLQIFNSKGERRTHKSYHNPTIKISNIKEIYANFLNKNNPSYVQYLNSFITKDRIYALYLNETWEDILAYNYTDFEIHVFDWNLNPIQKINIVDHIDTMASFIILEETNEIIFVNPNQNDTYYTKWSF